MAAENKIDPSSLTVTDQLIRTQGKQRLTLDHVPFHDMKFQPTVSINFCYMWHTQIYSFSRGFLHLRFPELCLYHLYYIVLLNIYVILLLINIYLGLIFHFNGLFIINIWTVKNILQEQRQEQEQEQVQEQEQEQERVNSGGGVNRWQEEYIAKVGGYHFWLLTIYYIPFRVI